MPVQPVYLKDRDFLDRHTQPDSMNDSSAFRLGSETFKLKKFNGNKLEIQNDLGMPVNHVRIKSLEDRIRKNIISDENSLHSAIAPVLTLAHFFGIFPVQGIYGPNTTHLNFKWFSWPILYVFVILTLCFSLNIFSIVQMCRVGLTYNIIDLLWETDYRTLGRSILEFTSRELLFFGCSLVIYIVFTHLAREWPKIMAKWELMEREIKQFERPHNIALKFKILTSIVVLLSTIEYVASVVTALFKAQHCSTGGIDIFRAYFSMNYNQVFSVIQYSIAIALPLEVLNFILSVASNYMDLFIIILASAMSDKFKHLNEKLDTVKGKVLPSMYWRKFRESYNLLASLTRDFDEFLSPVILLSFAHNLYFICLHLLYSLKPMYSICEALCFVFLFTYLVGRTCAVSLYAASVNDQSKKPKAVLFSVPTESYGVEISLQYILILRMAHAIFVFFKSIRTFCLLVQSITFLMIFVARFLTQVASDELALTGYNFFAVTRTFMLTVAGTIVTYEIVLIQFNNVANGTIPTNVTHNYCP